MTSGERHIALDYDMDPDGVWVYLHARYEARLDIKSFMGHPRWDQARKAWKVPAHQAGGFADYMHSRGYIVHDARAVKPEDDPFAGLY